MVSKLSGVYITAIACPWLNFEQSPRCPNVVWCHSGEINPFLLRRLRMGWQSVISQGKISRSTLPRLGVDR